MIPAMWTYKGQNVWPHDRNSAGLRWEAFTPWGRLRSDSKAGMRQLITETIERKGN